MEHQELFSSADNPLHILSFGMGWESSAILVRWLLEPETRGFGLDRLVVIVAMTGDEYDSTGKLIEQYILPLCRQFGVRFVQLARGGRLERDGYSILDSSTNPQQLYLQGDYPLSQELISSGTIPRLGRPHFCAMKYKGFVIDSFLQEHVTGFYHHYLGYSVGEEKRSSKSDGYTKHSEVLKYPAIEWGWTRADCGDYLTQVFGVAWEKSCCQFCPFQEKESVRLRWLAEPEAGGFAAYVEAIALSFNPRMHLFSFGSAYDLLVESGNTAALSEYHRRLAEVDWAIYRVQRLYKKITTQSCRSQVNADRNIFAVDRGSRMTMLRAAVLPDSTSRS